MKSLSTAKQPKAPRPLRKGKNQETHEKHEIFSKKQEIIIRTQGMQENIINGFRITSLNLSRARRPGRCVQAKIRKTKKMQENSSKKQEIIIWKQEYRKSLSTASESLSRSLSWTVTQAAPYKQKS